MDLKDSQPDFVRKSEIFLDHLKSEFLLGSDNAITAESLAAFLTNTCVLDGDEDETKWIRLDMKEVVEENSLGPKGSVILGKPNQSVWLTAAAKESFTPHRFVINAPCPGFFMVTDVRIANLAVNIGNMDDAWHYSGKYEGTAYGKQRVFAASPVVVRSKGILECLLHPEVEIGESRVCSECKSSHFVRSFHGISTAVMMIYTGYVPPGMKAGDIFYAEAYATGPKLIAVAEDRAKKRGF